jgi:thioredoxin-related protein
MLVMAWGAALFPALILVLLLPVLSAPAALAQAPMYKTPQPAGLLIERWKQTGNADLFFDFKGDDLRHELWLASREGKNGLLLFFRGSDNSYSDLMKDTVLRNDEVQGYFKARLRTIVLDRGSARPLINLRGESVTEARVAGEFGITRTPAFVFFDLKGDQRYLHPRPIFDAAAMITFARCMADGIYDRSEVERSLRGG